MVEGGKSKTVSRLDQDLARHANGENFRRFCIDRFAGTSLEAKKASAIKFIKAFFSHTTVVQNHQTKFAQAFISYMTKLHCNGEPLKVPSSDTQSGYVVFYADEENQMRGSWIYPYEFSLMWIIDFHMSDPPLIHSLQSLAELPRPYILAFFEKDDHSSAPLRKALLSRVLRPESFDQSEWWNNSKVLAETPDLLMLQSDKELVRLLEDHYPAVVLETRADLLTTATTDNKKKKKKEKPLFPLPKKPPPVPKPLSLIAATFSDATVHRIIATTYLHAAQVLSTVDPATLDKTASLFGGKHDLLLRLFPTIIQMLNAETIPIYDDALLADLNSVDGGKMIDVMAQIAEDIRSTLILSQVNVVSYMRDKVIKNPQVAASFNYTETLSRATSLYFDTRHRMLVDKKLLRTMRWVYSTVGYISFSQFLHELGQGLQTIEFKRLGAWLLEVSSSFFVDIGDVMKAKSLTDLIDECEIKDDEYRKKKVELATRIREHIEDCDRTFAVLRFPSTVRYHELLMTFDYVCKLHPEKMQAKLVTTTSTMSQHWQSSRVYVGADCRGVYIVGFRAQLEIIRQINLLDTLLSKNYSKNMPLFPLLTRFYFGKFQHPVLTSKQKEEKKEEQQQQSTVPFFQEPKGIDDGRGTGLDCDDHAVHVVSQTLGHWLRLPTENSCAEHLTQKLKKETKRPRAASTHPLSHSYIPCVGENFFPCMRYAHRLADQLSCAAVSKKRDFPSIPDYNALADFLELRRPRMVKKKVLLALSLKINEFYDANRGGEAEESSSELIRAISVVKASLTKTLDANVEVFDGASNNDNNNNNNNNKKMKKEEPTETTNVPIRVPLLLAGWDHLDGDDKVSMTNWIILYVPVINNILTPQMVEELMCEDAIVVDNRPRIDEHTFKDRLYRSSKELGVVPISDFLERYTECFVTPSVRSHRKLDEKFLREPMQAMFKVLKSLEEIVSSDSLERLMKKHIPTDTFDFYTLFDETRYSTSTAPTNAVDIVDTLNSDSRSMLPIQAYQSPDKVEFAFYESSFALVLFTGTEYARFMGPKRASEELEEDEDYCPSASTSQRTGFFILVDIVLRFSPQLLLLRASNIEAAWRSVRDIRAYQRAQDPKQPLPRSFSSVSEVLDYVDKIKRTETINQIMTKNKKQLTSTNDNINDEQDLFQAYPTLSKILTHFASRAVAKKLIRYSNTNSFEDELEAMLEQNGTFIDVILQEQGTASSLVANIQAQKHKPSVLELD